MSVNYSQNELKFHRAKAKVTKRQTCLRFTKYPFTKRIPTAVKTGLHDVESEMSWDKATIEPAYIP